MRINLTDEEYETLRRATEVFGYNMMLDILHEEMGELFVAISQKHRARTHDFTNVKEEVGDCLVVLAQWAVWLGQFDIEEISTQKLKRLQARIESNDFNLNTLISKK